MRQLFSLRKNKFFWSITFAVLAGLIVGLMVWKDDTDSKQFRAVVSLGDSGVRIYGVSCLSIDQHRVIFDRKDYSDPTLVEAIVDILAIKTVVFNADYGICPWGFFVTVVPGLEPAVRLDGQPARFLISTGICMRTQSGTLNPSKCLNKNVYVFNADVGPHELFSIALVGLARSQSNKREMFQGKRRQ